MEISRTTRKNIVDWLTVEGIAWSGRLDDLQFLGRIYDLEAMPSTDRRFQSAASDIRQHRLNNYDWEDDWIYTDPRFDLLACPEDQFLTFLAETLHPVVRPEASEVTRLAEVFNDFLREDGFELVARTKIGGLPVWAGQRRSLTGGAALPALRAARGKFDAEYVLRQITRMETAVEDDPALAIGTAKELVETTCKAILEARGKPVVGREDLPKLVRLVAEELALVPEKVSPTVREPETVRKILGSLTTLVSGIAELRNVHGTGHGRSPTSRPLSSRHAKLAVGAASTLAVFLFETHQVRSSP